MTETEIIIDWLSHKENRRKMPVKNVTETEHEAFANYGHIYIYGEEEVGCLGKQYFKLIKT